ncbi:hypothetical protein D3C79_1044990 [compost metagenome]
MAARREAVVGNLQCFTRRHIDPVEGLPGLWAGVVACAQQRIGDRCTQCQAHDIDVDLVAGNQLVVGLVGFTELIADVAAHNDVVVAW